MLEGPRTEGLGNGTVRLPEAQHIMQWANLLVGNQGCIGKL